jgi:Fe2+ transport system protein FeoA
VSPERPKPGRPTLANLPVGGSLRVSDVDPAHAEELLREGLLSGALVRVASRTPLGGPVIVVLGRSRLALSADVAAAVHGERLA